MEKELDQITMNKLDQGQASKTLDADYEREAQRTGVPPQILKIQDHERRKELKAMKASANSIPPHEAKAKNKRRKKTKKARKARKRNR